MTRLRSEARGRSGWIESSWRPGLTSQSWRPHHTRRRRRRLGPWPGQHHGADGAHGDDGVPDLLAQGDGASRLLQTVEHHHQALHRQRLLGNSVFFERAGTHHTRDLPLEELDCGGNKDLSMFPDFIAKPLLKVEIFSSAGHDGQINDKRERLAIEHHAEGLQILGDIKDS